MKGFRCDLGHLNITLMPRSLLSVLGWFGA